MVVSAATAVPLTFTYDAANNTYTLSGGGKASSFGPAQFLGYDSGGDARFSRATANGFDILDLFSPARLGGGTRYVGAGLWQNRTMNSNSIDDFEFDVFVYGFPTVAANVPLSGSATYDIDLFGVVSPVGNFPRSVIGDGTFSLDFAQGLFAMSGSAGEYNNDANYHTCCAPWRGAGYLASNGGLSGYFAYDGRDRFSYQATVAGSLFGPDGSEVGGSMIGGDADFTFTGIFVGTRERSGIDSSLNVLGEGARDYFTTQGSSAALQRYDSDVSDSAAYYFPASFGKIEFRADNSVLLSTGISDPRHEDVTFARSDIVAAQSDARFTVYEVNNANGNHQLKLFTPGAANPEIELTYSSFGHWQQTRAIAEAQRHTLSTWFSYGARTAEGTLPATGTAHYNAIVTGSGERHGDMERLTLAGTSAIDIDFAAMQIDGTLDIAAWTTANQMVELPSLFFGAAFEGNTFNALLQSAPGYSPGSIAGVLYGPGGEEIGGSFDFFTRAFEGGPADASYSGVFYGTRD